MKTFQNCQSPWMDTEELAEYLRFKTTDAARMFVYRHGIPHVKFGGKLLFNRAVIDEWLNARERVSLEQSLTKYDD